MTRRKTSWKAAFDELAWVVGCINLAHTDSNPNRAAQINLLLRYGNDVSIAARSGEPLPKRPDYTKAC